MTAGPRQKAFNAAVADADLVAPLLASIDWKSASTILDELAGSMHKLNPEIISDFEGQTGTTVAARFLETSESLRDKVERFRSAHRALEGASDAIGTAKDADRELTGASAGDTPDPTTGADPEPDPAREQRAAAAYRQLDSAMSDFAKQMRAVHTDPEPAAPQGGGGPSGGPSSGPSAPGGSGGGSTISLGNVGNGHGNGTIDDGNGNGNGGTDNGNGDGSTGDGGEVTPILLPPGDDFGDGGDGGTTGPVRDAWAGFGDSGSGGSGAHPAVLGGAAGAGALGALGAAGLLRGGALGGTSTTAVSGVAGRTNAGPLGGRPGGASGVLGRGGAAPGSTGSPVGRGQGGAAGRGVGAGGTGTRGAGGRGAGGRGAGGRGAGGRGLGAGGTGTRGGRRGNGSDDALDHDHYDVDEDWTDDESVPSVLDSRFRRTT